MVDKRAVEEVKEMIERMLSYYSVEEVISAFFEWIRSMLK